MKWKKDHKLPNTKTRNNSSSSTNSAGGLGSNPNPGSDLPAGQEFEGNSPSSSMLPNQVGEHAFQTVPAQSIYSAVNSEESQSPNDRVDKPSYTFAPSNFKYVSNLF